MIRTLYLDDTGEKAKAFLEFVKTLDFVSEENEEFTLSTDHIKELDAALKEHEEGKANYKSWDSVRQQLFKKNNIK